MGSVSVQSDLQKKEFVSPECILMYVFLSLFLIAMQIKKQKQNKYSKNIEEEESIQFASINTEKQFTKKPKTILFNKL